MDRYYKLDTTKSSSKMTAILTWAGVLITIVVLLRLLIGASLSTNVYGSPISLDRTSYTVTGTGKVKDFDSSSPAAHCLRAVKSARGVNTFSGVSYGGYIGDGVHSFVLEGYDGVPGETKVARVLFEGGSDLPMCQDYYQTELVSLQ